MSVSLTDAVDFYDTDMLTITLPIAFDYGFVTLLLHWPNVTHKHVSA